MHVETQSVSTVWISQGTAATNASRKAPRSRVGAFGMSWAKAGLEVRSMATKWWSLPSPVRGRTTIAPIGRALLARARLAPLAIAPEAVLEVPR